MPIDIPTEANEAKNKLNNGLWYWRMDLTLSDATGPFRFVNNTEAVTIAGNVYNPLPFTISEKETKRAGAIPTRTISIGNADITSFLMPYIKDKDGLRGATLVLTKVYADEPTIDMSNTAETYTVKGMTASDKWIVVRAGGPNLMLRRCPAMQYRNDGGKCRHLTKTGGFKGIGCGYAGAATSCDGTRATCVSLSNEANFGAEPGLNAKVVRMA